MAELSRRSVFVTGGGLLAGGYLAQGIGAAAAAAPAEGAVPAAAVPMQPARREWDAAQANQVWPPQRQVWTPIGWKDHLFRFTVHYNGVICAEPGPVLASKPNTTPYLGMGTQLEFIPPDDYGRIFAPEDAPYFTYRKDLGLGEQGWHDSPTPQLWSRWRLKSGLVIRQSVFAYVPGAVPVDSAIEPIYAWIRLTVEQVDERSAPDSIPFVVRLARRHLSPGGVFNLRDGVVVHADPAQAPLPGAVRAEPSWSPDGRPVPTRILTGDGKVRLAVGPQPVGSVSFAETAQKRVYDLTVTLRGEEGAHVDLLMPMLSQSRADFDAELAMGYDNALAEADAYWTETTEQGARIVIPERNMQDLVTRNHAFAEVIAEKSPDTSQYTFLSGNFSYDVLWATPSSMSHHMMLDLIGLHQTSLKYLELFRHNQGTVKPPGQAYEKHPGYFSTPANLRAIDWTTDHGAIMTSIATNALMSGSSRQGRNRVFVENWTEPLIKACEFIKDALAITDHEGVKGLMPPGVASDEELETQAVWSQAWNYKGLALAVKVLRQIGHPRTDEFDEVRETFRTAIVHAYRELMSRAPKWTHPDGRKLPVPATEFAPRPPHPYQDAFLLDTGPMILVWAGVFPADDELMVSAVDFFRVGPNQQLWGPQSNAVSRAVLQHEISSCEPCYSWNIHHSWQLGDREKFLEGMYSMAIGGCSPQTFISSEHRHGMYSMMVTAAHAVWCIRQSVVDDQLVDGELHLLRLMPLSWLEPGFETVFEDMPTVFGPISLRITLPDKRTLRVEQTAEWWERPKQVILHVPPAVGVDQLVVNGTTHQIAGKQQVPIEIR